MGEATEILTGGLLQATLHCVQVFVGDARICKRWCTSCLDSAIHILRRHLKSSLSYTLLFTGSLWWECNWSGTQHLCSIHAASLVGINKLNFLLCSSAILALAKTPEVWICELVFLCHRCWNLTCYLFLILFGKGSKAHEKEVIFVSVLSSYYYAHLTSVSYVPYLYSVAFFHLRQAT